MNERRKARRNRPRAVRDLLLISLVALVVFWLGAVTGGFELAHRWVMRRFPTRVDDILVALGLATLGLWVFSLLRWRQARRETRARAAAEHRYRTLVEEMPAVTYVGEALHHEDGASKYIAPGIEQLLGFTPEQWLDDRIAPSASPVSADDMAANAEQIFAAFDANESAMLAQWATAVGRAMRAKGRKRRLEAYEAALREVTSHLSRTDARAALAILSYLLSSWTWKTLRDEFGMAGDESGKAVAWALRTLIDDLRKRNGAALTNDTQPGKET